MAATPGSSEWRAANWPACESAKLVTRQFGPQWIKLTVARGIEEAVDALFDVFAAHNYILRQKVTGAYNCRKITNGSVPSAHASGIAIDANWDTNPYVKGKLVTDMPRDMVKEALEIRTVDGFRVWRWGGDWDHRPDTPHKYYDAMHWEVIATLFQLRKGIHRVIRGDRLATRPILRAGAIGPAVTELNRLLAVEGYPAAGDAFLSRTHTQVRDYQGDRGLKVDGVVGAATWTALVNRMPILAAGDLKPNKDVM